MGSEKIHRAVGKILKEASKLTGRAGASALKAPLSSLQITFERMLAYQPEDIDLAGFGNQFVDAVLAYLVGHDERSLGDVLTRCEPLVRVLLELVAPDRLNKIKSKGLSTLLFNDGLRIVSGRTLDAKHPDDLAGMPRFACEVGWVIFARNHWVHLAQELNHRERAELFERVCVFLCFVVSEHKEALDSVLLTRSSEEYLRGLVRRANRPHGTLQLDMREIAAPETGSIFEPAAVEMPGFRGSETASEEDEGELEEARFGMHRQGPVLELIKQVPRMVLLGGPGAGKTTTMQYLAGRLAKERLDEPALGTPIPVFVELSLYSHQPGFSLSELILRPLSGLLGDLDSVCNENIILLFDGMNEVHPELLPSLRRELRLLMATEGPLRMMVSSRPGIYRDDFHCPVFDLQPLDDERISELIHVTLGGLAEEFIKALRLQPKLWEWGRNPLNLEMLIAMGGREGSLNLENRGRLLQRFLNGIFIREETQGHMSVDQFTWEKTFSHLGYETRREGSITFDRVKAVRHIKEAAGAIGALFDVPKFLSAGLNARVLATVRDEQTLAFTHEMYQEYFAALGLLDRAEEDPDLLDRLATDPLWEEPLVIYSGLTAKRLEFLTRLARNAPDIVARSLNANLAEESEVRASAIQSIQDGLDELPTEESVGKAIQALLELGQFDQALKIIIPSHRLNLHFSPIAKALAKMDADRIAALCLVAAREVDTGEYVLRIVELALRDRLLVPEDPALLESLQHIGGEESFVQRSILSIFAILPVMALGQIAEKAMRSGRKEMVNWACVMWLKNDLSGVLPFALLLELAVENKSLLILQTAWHGAHRNGTESVDEKGFLEAALKIRSYDACKWTYSQLVRRLVGPVADHAVHTLITNAFKEGTARTMGWAIRLAYLHQQGKSEAFREAVTAAFRAKGHKTSACIKAIMQNKRHLPCTKYDFFKLANRSGNLTVRTLLEEIFSGNIKGLKHEPKCEPNIPTPNNGTLYLKKSLSKEEKRHRISELLSNQTFEFTILYYLSTGGAIVSNPLFPEDVLAPGVKNGILKPGSICEGRIDIRRSNQGGKWVYVLVDISIPACSNQNTEHPALESRRSEKKPKKFPKPPFFQKNLLEDVERNALIEYLSGKQYTFVILRCLSSGGGFASNPNFPENVFVLPHLMMDTKPGTIMRGEVDIRFNKITRAWNFVLANLARTTPLRVDANLQSTPVKQKPKASAIIIKNTYSHRHLMEESGRIQISEVLAGQRFQVVLSRCMPGGGGFASHPMFKEGVFVWGLKPGAKEVGAVLDGRIEIRWNEKKRTWNFVLVDFV